MTELCQLVRGNVLTPELKNSSDVSAEEIQKLGEGREGRLLFMSSLSVLIGLHIGRWFVPSRSQLICNFASGMGLGHWAQLVPSWGLFIAPPETFGSSLLDGARLTRLRGG